MYRPTLRSISSLQALLFTTTLLILSCADLSAQGKNEYSLEKKLEQVIAPCKATIGIAVTDMNGSNNLITINDGHHYPMQSVYKFPLAICILSMVDHNRLSLDTIIHIRRAQLRKHTWSPLAEKYSKGEVDITLSELLNYCVSKSDNNACDILFEIAGGTGAVNNYIHNAGVRDIAIVATENDMHTKGWEVQYRNWCRPSAMLQLIQLFYEGKLLSRPSQELLMGLMTESENSAGRIKGQLPKGTIVAHKTGTSGANKDGLNAAINDVGIITLPRGHHIAIVVFVSDYTGTTETGEQAIAQVAKCVWNHYAAAK